MQWFIDWLQAKFQHTAARKRLLHPIYCSREYSIVSTHSRPKAAATTYSYKPKGKDVSTHSRPKAAASILKGYSTQS